MTFDEYVEKRNRIQLATENQSKQVADECWVELGVANRHLQRVADGVVKLSQVEGEIKACLRRVEIKFNISHSS